MSVIYNNQFNFFILSLVRKYKLEIRHYEYYYFHSSLIAWFNLEDNPTVQDADG